ncbi:Mov34/MPN/PAD-1 family protein [Paenibacillus dauci]|uniref:Mov34/MPN/PAD-1 family protein n=1 Tax=Paenibacillus dauci TaxID=1567106 RepID=UPI000619C16A|nr:Mov34/MPN/PAD-1 family protein [Paenibacillus dauci]
MADLLGKEKNPTIHLASSALEQIATHMVSSPAAEVCGVLLGKKAAGGMHIHSYHGLRNVAPDPLHHFSFAPEEWIPYCFQNNNLIGIFHSHPLTAPIPSITDTEQLPEFASMISAYLIGSPAPLSDKYVASTERAESAQGIELVNIHPPITNSLPCAIPISTTPSCAIHSICDISSLPELHIGSYQVARRSSSSFSKIDAQQPMSYALLPAILHIG